MSVLAFAEQRGGALRSSAFETLTAGRELADALGVELIAVLLGPAGLAAETGKLGSYGADRVLTGFSDAFAEYAPESYTELVAKAAQEAGAKAVLFAASAQGKDLAPRAAARLKAGLASDVTEVRVADGRVVAVRPAYAGKVFMRVGFIGEPAMLSVRPRAYKAVEAPRDARVEELAVGGDVAGRTKVRAAEGEAKERPDVAEAEIVVSGGRGLGSPDNWKLLEELADALGSGAGLGASRAVVDAGWRPHGEQVGQTGKVVAPPLYFAFGISGAIQHLAGMQTAGCIVAVNKDPEAPIFKIADYGIVGDALEVLPRLIEEIKRPRS
ncbi:MAG: electron transfer flavoprotein subunit alpha/FixB family protein [Gemmatimonadota bacterium]|nr:MAG: electron transfer flavoprotein subunit alpha/FixB family protein [Gemmatimonadota bacterium]